MAWSFTDLRYGWKIATGIALASTTIYVANNTRWRVNQADVIELALGVDERVMALQTGTNAFGAPVYLVARPSFVRNWITNNYETQVVGGVTSVVAVAYTNTFTNTIGYRTDHAMMVELDAKLKEIVPYYVDTNTFLHLTFTGLLASLSLGDGTNFTRTPAIGTNAATYGELPWRIYVEDLQERYKVLNALRYIKYTTNAPFSPTSFPLGISVSQKGKWHTDFSYDTRWFVGWDRVKNYATESWEDNTYPVPSGLPRYPGHVGRWSSLVDFYRPEAGDIYEFINAYLNQGWLEIAITYNTQLRPTLSAVPFFKQPGSSTGDTFDVFSDVDYDFYKSSWTNQVHVLRVGLSTNEIDSAPGWPNGYPPTGWNIASDPGDVPDGGLQTFSRGYWADYEILIDFVSEDTNAPPSTNALPRSFQYCTNKYW